MKPLNQDNATTEYPMFWHFLNNEENHSTRTFGQNQRPNVVTRSLQRRGQQGAVRAYIAMQAAPEAAFLFLQRKPGGIYSCCKGQVLPYSFYQSSYLPAS